MKDYKNIAQECLECRLNKYIFNVDLKGEELKQFQNKQLNILDTLDLNANSTDLDRLLAKEYENKFGKVDYKEIKYKYNDILLKMYDEIENRINSSKDDLYTAIKYSLIGNYIDFAALSNVDINKLYEFLDDDSKIVFNIDTYHELLKELDNSKTIVYLCDNCGEIVFDKLLIKTIKKHYPNILITAVVRGAEVMNDANMNDARQVGLMDVCEVIDNGSDYMGTFLDKISKECFNLINKADLIISKGQANAESLIDSDLNIYYVFLCKCEHFAKRYKAHQYDAILTK